MILHAIFCIGDVVIEVSRLDDDDMPTNRFVSVAWLVNTLLAMLGALLLTGLTTGVIWIKDSLDTIDSRLESIELTGRQLQDTTLAEDKRRDEDERLLSAVNDRLTTLERTSDIDHDWIAAHANADSAINILHGNRPIPKR